MGLHLKARGWTGRRSNTRSAAAAPCSDSSEWRLAGRPWERERMDGVPAAAGPPPVKLARAQPPAAASTGAGDSDDSDSPGGPGPGPSPRIQVDWRDAECGRPDRADPSRPDSESPRLGSASRIRAQRLPTRTNRERQRAAGCPGPAAAAANPGPPPGRRSRCQCRQSRFGPGPPAGRGPGSLVNLAPASHGPSPQ
jgi:hypothetical protein